MRESGFDDETQGRPGVASPSPFRNSHPMAAQSDQNEKTLKLRFVGSAAVEVDEKPLFQSSRNARALLAYVALDRGGEGIDRKQLASLLWPDTTDDNAFRSLRVLLFSIRRQLERASVAALQVRRDTLWLDGQATKIDMVSQLQAIKAGEIPDELLERPCSADSLLTGLDGLNDLYDGWLNETRQRYRERLGTALATGYANEAAPPAQRLRAAQAALNLDPLNERACQAVMRLAAGDGDYATALRAYERLYVVFDEEMDNEPSPSTQALAVQIKLGAFDEQSGSVSDRAAPPSATTETDVLRTRDGADDAPVEMERLRPASARSTGEPRIAVLPFSILGPEPVPEFFAQGICEDTTCYLATLQEPVVISGNTTRAIDVAAHDFVVLRQELGIQYVVSGSIRHDNANYRVAVKLIEIASGTVVWAQVYDAPESEVLATHADIAANIAVTLAPNLRKAELRRTRDVRIENLTVYHLTLRARDLIFRLEPESFNQAGVLLRRAAALDANYCPAQVNLASWHSIRLGQGWSPDRVADAHALDAAARRAIELDDFTGRALAMLGHNRTILARQYDKAVTFLDRAVEASPNDPETLMWCGPTFAYMGEPEMAISRIERAITLSPRDPFMFRYEHFMSIAHYAAGAFEEAAHWGHCAYLRNPRYTSNLRMTAAAYVGAGQPEEARPLIEHALTIEPNFRVAESNRRGLFRAPEKQHVYAAHLVEAGLPV